MTILLPIKNRVPIDHAEVRPASPYGRVSSCLVLTLTIVLATLVHSAYGSDPLPANRKLAGVGWAGLVGVPGGIPNRTNIYTTLAAGASQATIQNAINNCPSNHVVLLSAGTYTINNTLTITRNGITLRGAGSLTVINSSAVLAVRIGDWKGFYYDWVTPVASRHINWTSGYAQGTKTITVSSVSGLSVGQFIYMDQLNAADVTYTNWDNRCDDASYTSVAYPLCGKDRIQQQLNRIAAINGTTITLYEPLYAPNWSGTLSPQIWYWTQASPDAAFSGIEDMKINAGSNQGVEIDSAYGCWAKNVWVTGAGVKDRGQFLTWAGLRSAFISCRITGPMVSGNDPYGYHIHNAAGFLVENCIFENIPGTIVNKGGAGCVFAYNYATNMQPNNGWLAQGFICHGAWPYMNLYEGNYSSAIGLEPTYGGGNYNVIFRNRLIGKSDNSTAAGGNSEPVQVGQGYRYTSVIGNVLGTAGFHTGYKGIAGGTCDGNISYIYMIGGEGGCQNAVPDSLVSNTLIRAYNWTSVTSSNGIVYDGYSASDIPPSYYLTTKPSWFGSLPWPPVDPANPSLSSGFTNFPAGYRFVNGVDPSSNRRIIKAFESR